MKKKVLNYALSNTLYKKEGFTLIEMLVTLAIFVVAIGAVTAFILSLYQTQAYNIEQSQAIEEARNGIETMTQELREATSGDDGSYIIEKAEDYEIIFYSDIDKDGETERVRYFIYESKSSSKECSSYIEGGSCQVDFNNFKNGTLESAKAEICIKGDLNGGNEYVDLYADGNNLGRACSGGSCDQCSSSWQGCQKFEVLLEAQDNTISFKADGSSSVGSWGGGFCGSDNHSMKARFNFSWIEQATGTNATLKKGVTNPSGDPLDYPEGQEQIKVISRYVNNNLPIFRYFDGEGNELSAPARLEETKLIRVNLTVNVNPEKIPHDFELESKVHLRNLKTNN
jgi:prepilin-type N-terminal cleavage/methylation domain-containing protein